MEGTYLSTDPTRQTDGRLRSKETRDGPEAIRTDWKTLARTHETQAKFKNAIMNLRSTDSRLPRSVKMLTTLFQNEYSLRN